MKKFFLLFGLTAFFAGVALAQTDDNQQTDQVNGPVMELESKVVDFGEIEQGSDPYRTLTFTNTGNEPLVIKHAKGSCGCTVPTWPKEPVMPNESSEIKVRYDTNRPGPINKRVTIQTNESVGQHVLSVKGFVKKKEAEPEGLPSSSPNILSGN